VLCRRNAPLVRHAYRLISKGIPAVIIGNDIGAALISVAEKISDGDHNMSISEFEPLAVKHFQKLLDKATSNKWMRKVDEITDKANALWAFQEKSKTVGDMIERIKTLFVANATNTDCVRLMSMHKSKGLEADIVIILRTPKVKCDRDWQETQEKNLQLVARTRAKLALYYVNDEPNKEKETDMHDYE
jgi:superfamily I DNA/RNA helicase